MNAAPRLLGSSGPWSPTQQEVESQYRAVQAEVLPGPGKNLRWGVPDGTRDADGALIHDDFVLADSLVTQLDNLDWHITAPMTLIYPTNQPSRYDHYNEFNNTDFLHPSNDHF